MNTKHNTYLDLSKLSDRERIIIRNILHEKREYVPFFTDLFEIERHYKLHFDKGDWLCGDSWFGEKTEISFPEWKAMMKGTSVKKAQVEYPDNSHQAVIAILEAENKELREMLRDIADELAAGETPHVYKIEELLNKER